MGRLVSFLQRQPEFLFPALPLSPTERILSSHPANWHHPSSVCGGRVLLTSQRLVFQRHRVDILLGTGDAPAVKSWPLAATDIRSIGVAVHGFVRPGLALTVNGHEEVITTRQADAVAQEAHTQQQADPGEVDSTTGVILASPREMALQPRHSTAATVVLAIALIAIDLAVLRSYARALTALLILLGAVLLLVRSSRGRESR